MSDENSEETQQSQKTGEFRTVAIKGTGQAATVYSNVTSVISTPFDIQFIFGELVEITDDHVTGVARARIIMSPEHAQIFLELLQLRVQDYERLYGPFRKLGAKVRPSDTIETPIGDKP
jgi:hypothetical protein